MSHRNISAVITAWIAVSCSTYAAPDDEAASLLRKCLETQAATDRFETDGSTFFEPTSLDGTTSKGRVEYQLKRTENSLDIYHRDRAAEGDDELKREHRLTITPQIAVGYQFSRPRHTGPHRGVVQKKDRDAAWVKTISCVFHFGMPLDGFMMCGDRRVAARLLDADDVALERDGNLAKISGTTPYGKVEVWLDEQKACLPMRVQIRKAGADVLCQDTTVAESQINPRFNKEGRGGVVAELRVTETKQIDGVWVPTAGTFSMVEHYKPSGKRTQKITYQRSNIDLSPAFDETTFTTDLPKGAPVTYMDDIDSGIEYAWDGQKVVVATAIAPD